MLLIIGIFRMDNRDFIWERINQVRMVGLLFDFILRYITYVYDRLDK